MEKFVILCNKVEKFSYFCTTYKTKEGQSIMINFIGEYRAKMDDKGRLIFPSAFKALMPAGAPARFVIRKNTFEECLDMFIYEEWEKESARIREMLNPFDREDAMFWRAYTRDRAVVEPDPKLGRMTIPRKLLELIGANKEIVFSGSDNKIEIWAAEKYDTSGISEEEFISLAGRFASKK